jgi:hypothetical protein
MSQSRHAVELSDTGVLETQFTPLTKLSGELKQHENPERFKLPAPDSNSIRKCE